MWESHGSARLSVTTEITAVAQKIVKIGVLLKTRLSPPKPTYGNWQLPG